MSPEFLLRQLRFAYPHRMLFEYNSHLKSISHEPSAIALIHMATDGYVAEQSHEQQFNTVTEGIDALIEDLKATRRNWKRMKKTVVKGARAFDPSDEIQLITQSTTESLLNNLRDTEGASITLGNFNSEADDMSRFECIEITAEWTEWKTVRFYGNTLFMCALNAVKYRDTEDAAEREKLGTVIGEKHGQYLVKTIPRPTDDQKQTTASPSQESQTTVATESMVVDPDRQ